MRQKYNIRFVLMPMVALMRIVEIMRSLAVLCFDVNSGTVNYTRMTAMVNLLLQLLSFSRRYTCKVIDHKIAWYWVDLAQEHAIRKIRDIVDRFLHNENSY